MSAPDEDVPGSGLDLERRPWSCAHLFRFPALADDAAQAGIRAALTQWTADFNAGNADKVCGCSLPT